MDPHTISILITTWNGDDILKRCLDSLVHVYQDPPKTIIIDNANLESTKALVGKYSFAIYIPSKRNLGFAGGNNLGWPSCNTKYVLLLNNDTEFTADSISPLITFMDSHPAVGAAQGSQVYGFNNNLSIGCGIMISPRSQPYAPGYQANINDPICHTAARVFAGNGGFLIVRRSAIDILGGRLFYSEFEAYYEDVDLGRRLGMCGYESWYVPTPPIIHHMGTTSKRINQNYAEFHTTRNQWYSLFTSYHAYGIVKFLPWLIVFYFIVPLFTFKWSTLRFNASAFHDAICHIAFIKTARREFLPLKKLSDREFLKGAIPKMPLGYYLGLNHL